MSLRMRLAAVYLLLMVPTLAIFGAALYLVARSELHGAVDRSLRADALAVETLLEHVWGPLRPADIELSRAGLDRQAVRGQVFQVLSPDGTVLYSSTPVRVQWFQPEVLAPPGVQTFERNGIQERVLSDPVVRLGEVAGYVVTQTSLEPTQRSLGTIRDLIIGGILITAVISVVPSYVVAGRGLRPVGDLAALAREIEVTADFSRRLPEVRAGEEMRRLSVTFNALIDRVESMLLAQRAFLADSSHELRRPLTILRTNIDVMNHPRLPEAERELVGQEMRREAELMSRLVSDLLLLSRDAGSLGRLEEVDLVRLCQQVLRTAEDRYPAHHFRMEAPASCLMRGDRQHLVQVVENLLENAASYTPAGSRVDVRIESVGGLTQIEVSDNGPGMSEADAARAFERFYRGEDARRLRREGSGLGLPIVRHVIEAHGGSVRLSSREGRGTTAIVSIPWPAESQRAGSNGSKHPHREEIKGNF